MNPSPAIDLSNFPSVVAALHRGDFSALDAVFASPPTSPSPLAHWLADGTLIDERDAFNEALTCACFNGRTAWAEALLDAGAELLDGARTGMNGFHWAANRGHVDTVQLLLRRGMPLEVHNSYGGTVLGCTVWSAVHEPRLGQVDIVHALLAAGADPLAADYPCGQFEIDAALRRARDAR